MSDTITLTGYLGKDPQIRQTAERTVTYQERAERLVFEHRGVTHLDRAEDLLEEPGEYDVTYPSRDYALISLATHSWDGRRRTTTWHRVVVWNVDRLEHLGVRLARKGSKVEIIGRRTSFTTRDHHDLQQIELTCFRVLQLR